MFQFNYATSWKEAGCPTPIPPCVRIDAEHLDWTSADLDRMALMARRYSGVTNEEAQSLFTDEINHYLTKGIPNRYGTTPQARPQAPKALRQDQTSSVRGRETKSHPPTPVAIQMRML